MDERSKNTNTQFTVALLSDIAFCSICIALTAWYVKMSFAKDSRPTINLALADASSPKSANSTTTSVAPDQQAKPAKKILITKKKPQKKTIVKKTGGSEVAPDNPAKETETKILYVNCGAVAGGIIGALLSDQVGEDWDVKLPPLLTLPVALMLDIKLKKCAHVASL